MTEREIFIAALHEKDPAARADYLGKACADDPELRARIEQLLDEQEQLGSFLEPRLGGPVQVYSENLCRVRARRHRMQSSHGAR